MGELDNAWNDTAWNGLKSKVKDMLMVSPIISFNRDLKEIIGEFVNNHPHPDIASFDTNRLLKRVIHEIREAGFWVGTRVEFTVENDPKDMRRKIVEVSDVLYMCGGMKCLR